MARVMEISLVGAAKGRGRRATGRRWRRDCGAPLSGSREKRVTQFGSRQRDEELCDTPQLLRPLRAPRHRYFSASTFVGAPSVTFPVSRLFWYEKIAPPDTAFRPMTFDTTVLSVRDTKPPVPCARTPLAPLSSDELRSTTMEVIEWPADVKAEMPLKALLATTLSRTCTEITPVEPVPLAKTPKVFFATWLCTMTTRAERDPAGCMMMPPPLAARPLFRIRLSVTCSLAVTPAGGATLIPIATLLPVDAFQF